MIHHGDEEIEQDNNVDDGKTPKHDQAPKSRELKWNSSLKMLTCILLYNVTSLMPLSSKLSRSIKPNAAQNKV